MTRSPEGRIPLIIASVLIPAAIVGALFVARSREQPRSVGIPAEHPAFCDQQARRADDAVPELPPQGPPDDPRFFSHLSELMMREPHVSPPFRRRYYGPALSQYGDLRLPRTPAPHPVAILIHGGAWSADSTAEYFSALADFLTCIGFATWNIEYRRLGTTGGGWPNTITDAGQAADFLRTLATEYPLDLARVIAVGHSAGGHLGLWLSGRRRLPAAAELHSPDPLALMGVVSLDGPNDLEHWPHGRAAIDALLGSGGPRAIAEQRLNEASPIRLLPLGLRQVVISSETNRLAFNKSYVAAATAKGDEVSLVVIPGSGHIDVADPAHPHAGPAIRVAALSLISDERQSAGAGSGQPR